MNPTIRFGMAASLAVSSVSHAVLYVHGYRDVPVVGTGFLLQASVLAALALLIALGGPGWLWYLAAAASAGSLIAFGLSRTVGLFGFSERGWQPAPHAAVSVGAEVLTVCLFVAAARAHTLRNRPSTGSAAGGPT